MAPMKSVGKAGLETCPGTQVSQRVGNSDKIGRRTFQVA